MRHFRGRSALYSIGQLGGAEAANLLELPAYTRAQLLPRPGRITGCYRKRPGRRLLLRRLSGLG